MSAIRKRMRLWLSALVLSACALPAAAQMRITEYMYTGVGPEFVEFTNVGAAAVDMTGWSFDDNHRLPGAINLTTFGTVAAGESVILTDASTAAAFRTAWTLCDAVKVIAGNTEGLGRADEINLYDAQQQLVDRLTYDDQTLGGPRTNGFSAWVSAAGIGMNMPQQWTLSAAMDGEGSYASASGDIGSPGKSTRATQVFSACQPQVPVLRITEYMYSGTNGEFAEFTNVGNAPLDMTGWSFDDNHNTPGFFSLGAYGVVQAGESVLLTDVAASAFRSAWHLCDGVKIIGSNSNHSLGRADRINLYDAGSVSIDHLTYDDQTITGTIRTNTFAGWPTAAGLGVDDIHLWTLASVNDAEFSVASTGADIGSPGRSTLATVAYDPCIGSPNAPTVQVDALATSLFLDLEPSGSGAVGGVINDPTDPAATAGIGFVFALPGGGDPSTLTVAATSSNSAVVDAAGLQLSGSGATRLLTIVPLAVGYSTITVRATDTNNNAGTYIIRYAASAPSQTPTLTRFQTGTSDASATIAVDSNTMLVADDENQGLRLFRRASSGLALASFDFTNQLGLTDISGGIPREVDLEGSARIGNRLYWTGSHSNSKDGALRPNRQRVFATDLSGTGDSAVLTYVGRYDHLREDLIAWDNANGHGLGAGALGFALGTAVGIEPERPDGFNIEGLAIAPDGESAYLAFRAPLLPMAARTHALIIPIAHFNTLVTGAAPVSLPAGSAEIGAPIFLDLGGRGVRSLDRNSVGDYLITAGPPAGSTGIASADFRLFGWNGQPAGQPFVIVADPLVLNGTGGSLESLVEVPAALGAGSVLQLVSDNGDTVWYADGMASKDLAEKRHAKFRSDLITVDIPPPSDVVLLDGFNGH
ncbi:MAG: lamin tail domain-containing protein [Dokdonella sp.]